MVCVDPLAKSSRSPDGGPADCTMLTTQLSEAVGSVHVTVASQARRVISVGIPMIIGLILSSTVIVAMALAELPLASITVKLTVFAPTFVQSKAVLSNV